MRQIFKDTELQRQYDEHGYVIVPFLDADGIAQLKKEYESLSAQKDDGFFSSLYTTNADYKKHSNLLLQPFAQAVLDKFMINYKVLIANFVTKKGENSQMPPHQDWTFVDELEHASINLWCPLTDVNHENGAIYLLSGGHKLAFTVRGTLIPSCFQQVTTFDYDRLTYLPMKAGEVLIYDHRLIHASPPNTLNEVRVAAAIATVPAESPQVHYILNTDTGLTDKYDVDQDFYFKYTFGENKIPEGTTFLESIKLANPEFTDADVKPLLRTKPQPTIMQRFLKLINA